jgi:hypothetical protein
MSLIVSSWMIVSVHGSAPHSLLLRGHYNEVVRQKEVRTVLAAH